MPTQVSQLAAAHAVLLLLQFCTQHTASPPASSGNVFMLPILLGAAHGMGVVYHAMARLTVSSWFIKPWHAALHCQAQSTMVTPVVCQNELAMQSMLPRLQLITFCAALLCCWLQAGAAE